MHSRVSLLWLQCLVQGACASHAAAVACRCSLCGVFGLQSLRSYSATAELPASFRRRQRVIDNANSQREKQWVYCHGPSAFFCFFTSIFVESASHESVTASIRCACCNFATQAPASAAVLLPAPSASRSCGHLAKKHEKPELYLCWFEEKDRSGVGGLRSTSPLRRAAAVVDLLRRRADNTSQPWAPSKSPAATSTNARPHPPSQISTHPHVTLLQQSQHFTHPCPGLPSSPLTF